MTLGSLRAWACWAYEAENKVLLKFVTGFKDVHIGIDRKINLMHAVIHLTQRHVRPDSEAAELLADMSTMFTRLPDQRKNNSEPDTAAHKLKTWDNAPGAEGFVTMDRHDVRVPDGLCEMLGMDADDVVAYEYSRYVDRATGEAYGSTLYSRGGTFTAVIVVGQKNESDEYFERPYLARRYIAIEGTGTYVEALPLKSADDFSMMVKAVYDFAEVYFDDDPDMKTKIASEIAEQFCTFDYFHENDELPTAQYFPVSAICGSCWVVVEYDRVNTPLYYHVVRPCEYRSQHMRTPH